VLLRSGRHVPPATRLAMLLGFALAVAACGGNVATAGAPTVLPSGVVAVEAKDPEFAFSPAAITVPAGAVTFSVKNVGTQDHELEILQGDQVVKQGEAIPPGSTKDATVTLAAGEYTFVCKLNGHDQLGMKGTLTVSG
jgi:plastocyanin